MSLSLVQSRALLGLQAAAVTVEVHLANGLPCFTLVGLADVEVKEARERVRSALLNCGLEFPHNKRITVNLAPADLPKDSGRFDLPIALGILAASGQIDGARLAGWEFARRAVAVGRAAAGARRAGHEPGAARRRRHGQAGVAARQRRGGRAGAAGAGVPRRSPARRRAPVPAGPGGRAGRGLGRVVAQPQAAAADYPDLADVKGQAGAKRALEIAAAGGHSLLLLGPPGSGKSMLAHRFAGLLPAMTVDEALQSAAIASLAGQFTQQRWGLRPTCSPHHTASAVALVGGGSPPRPGEISLAHNGVLFLDELPEFPRAALEALREPLETGQITISRAARRAEFPARFQFIGAMNPCPCGWLGASHKACRCTPDQVARYQGKLSGPLLDRIDLHVEVPTLPPEELLTAPAGESTASDSPALRGGPRARHARQGKANQGLQGKEIDTHAALDDAAAKFLNIAAARLGWSARSTHRALKVARTIADLAGRRPRRWRMWPRRCSTGAGAAAVARLVRKMSSVEFATAANDELAGASGRQGRGRLLFIVCER